MPATKLIQRHTSMSANIVAFCRHLRSEGFNISAAEEADALKTLEILDPFSAPETMRLALRTVLTRTPSQVIRFDELHDL